MEAGSLHPEWPPKKSPSLKTRFVEFRNHVNLKYPRQLGIFLLLAGCWTFYTLVVEPVLQLQAGAAQVEIPRKRSAISLVMIVAGIFYLVCGRAFAEYSIQAAEEKNSTAGRVIVGTALVLALLFWFAMDAWLASQGFDWD